MAESLFTVTQLGDLVDVRRQVREFAEGKGDRELSMAGLTFMAIHTKECAERWNKIWRGMKAVLILLSIVIIILVCKSLHIDPNGPLGFLSGAL